LEGLFRLLVSVSHFLDGYTVLARGDALNVFFILLKGGSQAEHLQEICLRVFWFWLEHSIELVLNWILREQNLLADYMSKVQEVDDFSLQPSVLVSILRDFGPSDVDRFASAHNAQLPVFQSEYWCPEFVVVNAFTFSWTGFHSLFPTAPLGFLHTSACARVPVPHCACRLGLEEPALVASAGQLSEPLVGTICGPFSPSVWWFPYLATWPDP
jgi:hypothetical protein